MPYDKVTVALQQMRWASPHVRSSLAAVVNLCLGVPVPGGLVLAACVTDADMCFLST